MASIEGTYVSNELGYTLVITNANDNTGHCDVELFLDYGNEPRITYQVEEAHYHFQNGDTSWEAKTLLALLAVGPVDQQELPFRVIVLRAENKSFDSFSAKEVFSTFSNHSVREEVYTRVNAPDPRGAIRRH